jgi:hypothetical protein
MIQPTTVAAFAVTAVLSAALQKWLEAIGAPWLLLFIAAITMCFEVHIHNSHCGGPHCKRLLAFATNAANATNATNAHAWAWAPLGAEYAMGVPVPRLLIGKTSQSSYPYIIWTCTSLVGYNAHVNTQVVEVRVRGSPPLVRAPALSPIMTGKGTTNDAVISVYELVTSNVHEADGRHEFIERVFPHGVPAKALAVSVSVAEQMADTFLDPERERQNCVFVLHGPPGTGKSSAARALTMLLRARGAYPEVSIVSDVDLQRPGECVNMLLSSYCGPDDALILLADEFDGLLSTISKNNCNRVKQTNDSALIEITDKRSWNCMLDRFTRKRHAVLVLTTNLTPDQLLGACRGDPSYLRVPGRITGFIDVGAHRKSKNV